MGLCSGIETTAENWFFSSSFLNLCYGVGSLISEMVLVRVEVEPWKPTEFGPKRVCENRESEVSSTRLNCESMTKKIPSQRVVCAMF